MTEFNVKELVDSAIATRLKYKPNGPRTDYELFAGSVGDWTKGLKVSHDLVTGEHEFSNGKGETAKKLTIEIDFTDAPICPHIYFADAACEALVDWAASEICGNFENQD